MSVISIKIRNGYKNILTDDIESMQNNINNLYKFENKNIILVRSNDLIQIISDFSSTEYMAIKCNLHGSSGKAFNFTDYQTIDKNTNITGITNGTLFKSAGDDIAPLHFCNSDLVCPSSKHISWKIYLMVLHQIPIKYLFTGL